MKKNLLLFSLLLSVSAAYSQTDASVMLNPTGFSTSASDNSFIATLPSGENLVTSTFYETSGEVIINIKKIQSNGTVSTVKNLVIPADSFSAALSVKGLVCSPGGEFTCMFGEGTNLYLVKFTAAAAIAWQKKITIPLVSIYYNHTLNQTPSGDSYITISDFGFMGIIKMDTNGNLLWNKKVTGPRETGKCPGFCSEVTQSGGCISTLKDDSFETIINLAPDGSLNWARSFTDFSYRWTKSIKADNLGNFYIMGTYGYGLGSNSFVQKMDANGNFIYAKNFDGTTAYEDAFVSGGNELFLLSESPTLKLTKMGATGNVAWSKGIGGTVPSSHLYTTYFSKKPASNISFLTWLDSETKMIFKFSGNPAEICNSYNYVLENTFDDAQILAAEIDTTANINPLTINVTNTGFGISTTEYYTSQDFCSYIASVNETTAAVDLNIYPNPAADFVTVDLSRIANTGNALITMYDMTGKKVFEKQLNNSSMDKISTADFAPGLYTIMIANSSEIIGKQKVIIQK